MSESKIRIALILPDVLGTYGDGGNVIVLAQRLHWRGHQVEVVEVDVDSPVPNDCDIYLLGGGEDTAQQAAVTLLRRHPGMQQAIDKGAAVFAICAGLQVLGTSFTGADGILHGGLGLLDVTTTPMGRRAIGELIAKPDPALGIGTLTGFENHGGATKIGTDARALGTVIHGVGNGVDRFEGVYQGKVIGTYLHGPALARNPELADLLIQWATGLQLAPLDLPEVDLLRRERLAIAD
ncbi:glutamine amidotransferase [Pseudonocardiaceae bacterium YIM PH 21723]|nr:glutamine amidotransferase [Pseudonocardiaceae bacterium YIM PH 21723]